MPHIDPSRFVEWGHQASQEFLEHNTPLNQSITKIARDYSLTPLQIQRVAEQANLETNNELFKTSSDKNFSFDLADIKSIVSHLDAPVVKTASDYDLPPNIREPQDYKKAFGLKGISNEPEVMQKVAELNHAKELIKKAREEVDARIAVAAREVVGCQTQLYKMAKQYHLNGGDLHELHKAAQAGLDDKDASHIVSEEFGKVARKLAAEGAFGSQIRFKVAEAVQDEHVSSKLDFPVDDRADASTGKVLVVNGSHPVVKTVNTLVSQISTSDALKRSTAVLDGKAHFVDEKVKDLNDSKKTDEWIRWRTE